TSPCACKPWSNNAPASSINCTSCWPAPFPNWPCWSKTSPPAGCSNWCTATRPQNCSPERPRPTSKRFLTCRMPASRNPWPPQPRIGELLAAARDSIGSVDGELAEQLVRDQVRQVRDSTARQKRLENLLVAAYHALPDPNYLDTLKGFGAVTAAVLTAAVADIDAVHTPGQLVCYFGVLPIEVASGVDRDGNPRGPKRYVMSRRGNDLVRRYLWMAALSAAQHNPACRALYARVRAKHPDRPAIAIGHVMRKLLHLAFAIWKTKKPFDPKHYDWDRPRHMHGSATRDQESGASDISMSTNEPAAGLKPDMPARSEVTAAGSITR